MRKQLEKGGNGITLFDWFLMLFIFQRWMHADIPSWVIWTVGGFAGLLALLKFIEGVLKRSLDKLKMQGKKNE
jgi:hypothetical protein